MTLKLVMLVASFILTLVSEEAWTTQRHATRGTRYDTQDSLFQDLTLDPLSRI